MIYTVWVEDDSPGSFTLIQGKQLTEKHKQLCSPMHLVKRFDAKSPNDAVRQYYEWQGWGAYKPMLDADGREYPEDELPFDESAKQS